MTILSNTERAYMDIPHFERYKISQDGIVVNKFTGKVLVPKLNGKNLTVHLTSNFNDRTTRNIDSLLSITWKKK